MKNVDLCDHNSWIDVHVFYMRFLVYDDVYSVNT